MGSYVADMLNERAQNLLGLPNRHMVTKEQVRDAERLLGTEYSRSWMPWRSGDLVVNPWVSDDSLGPKELQVEENKKAQVGLLGLGERVDPDMNIGSTWDVVIDASGWLRDGVDKIAPGLVLAIDSLDQSLFDLTGGAIGTPKNITPEQQRNLRDHLRMQQNKRIGGLIEGRGY